MKKILLLLQMVICINFLIPGQTIYYYGVNNKSITDEENAITRIEIRLMEVDRLEIQTSVKMNNEWINESDERVKIISDNEYLIRKFGNGRLIDKYVRIYTKESGEKFGFTEINNGTIERKGNTTAKIPLCLEGEVIEYYNNESVKSRSFYHDNQLLSNENWLQNGEKYIDNIFYSVDVNPSYQIEYETLQNHVFNEFNKHNLVNISGTILIGFVIMETGELAGVQVVKGIEPDIDQVAVDALKSFQVKWTPAVLNNSNVRCYCTMPINFRQDERNLYFNFLEYSHGVLFY